MSDYMVSVLRTVVPSLWGTMIAFVAAQMPLFASVTSLDSPGVISFVTLVSIALWHGLWRKLEPSVPDWLTQAVLGSAKQPTYQR